MKGFSYHFRRLKVWERDGLACRISTFGEDGHLKACGRSAVIEFRGVQAVSRGPEKVDRLTYCETHGAAVARLYGARIEASDDAA
jgi:hypothetical protein